MIMLDLDIIKLIIAESQESTLEDTLQRYLPTKFKETVSAALWMETVIAYREAVKVWQGIE